MMLLVGAMLGRYSLLAPAMVTIGVVSMVVGGRTIYTSQPTTCADSPVHHPPDAPHLRDGGADQRLDARDQREARAR
jgi:hypothetical protein